MPSNDLIVNVQQVGGYPLLDHLVSASDVLLVQQGGLGGPYKSITQDGLLGQVFERVNVGILPAPDNQGIASSYLITPLGQRQGFNWYVDDDGVQRYLQNGPAGYWSMVNTTGDLQFAVVPTGEKDDPITTTAWNIIFDLSSTGGLTIDGLSLTAPPSGSNSVVTQAWVQANTVGTFNTRAGPVTLTMADVNTALAVAGGDSVATHNYTTSLLNTTLAGYLPSTTTMVSTFNGRNGVVALTTADVTAAGGAPIASPALSGAPTAPTPAPGNSSTNIATTAFVASSFATTASLATYAPLASPTFTGAPSAPTATAGTNSGQLATTAFVAAAVVASTTGVSSFNTRTGSITLTAADVTAAGGALLASPTFTGAPAAPTATAGTATTQLATTAFVAAAVAGAGGVSTFNGRTGAVTLTAADLIAVGGALLAAPAFTGAPTAPTAGPGTNTTQLATTAFVTAAVAATVMSFNGRTGAVTLLAADISAAGGALLASPAFTGTPTAPTATAGTNSTQVATTAFVAASIGSGAGAPGGRLTLATGTPVLNATISNAGTVYYTPYSNNQVPLWNGSSFVFTPFAELTNVLANSAVGNAGPAAAAANQVYDLFVWNNAGAPTLTRGPPWSAGTGGSNTVRGAGAGSTALSRQSGYLVNSNAIANGPAAFYGAYVGTITTVGSSGATVSFSQGGAAAGGAAGVVGVWNAFNRRRLITASTDTTAAYAVGTTVGPVDGSLTMRTTFVQGLAEDSYDASFQTATAIGGGSYLVSIALDQITTMATAPGSSQGQGPVAATRTVGSCAARSAGLVLGAHFLTALEIASATGSSANENGDQTLYVELLY